MLKRIVKSFCLSILMLISIGILSACCSPAKFEVKVIFNGVDSKMGVSDYTQTIEYGDGVDVKFVIPIGYDYSAISATLNGKPYDLTVTLDDETVSKGYEYSTDRIVTLSVGKLTDSAEIKFDMSNVRKKTFDVTIDDKILSITRIVQGLSQSSNNLTALVIKPECANGLRSLKEEDILDKREFKNNSLKFEYGEHVILCYDKPASNSELEDIYSELGYFRNEKLIDVYNTEEVNRYRRADLGNIHYNYGTGNTRLFYIGEIRENLKLTKDAPGYKKELGFVVDNNENKFSLFTNMQDYSSDLLTINIYQPTNESYVASNNKMDKLEDITLKRIDKYNDEGERQNETILKEMYRRYDKYNMYVGSDIENDELISLTEKNSLTNELYISITSLEPLASHIKLHLLSYEKQSLSGGGAPLLTLVEYETSEKGQKIYRLDVSVVEKFLLDRKVESSGGEIISYKTGNAILFAQIDEAYINEFRPLGEFPYSFITYPINQGKISGYESGYKVEIYIQNDDGSRDYGFVDMHSRVEDCVYFLTDRIWTKNQDGSYTYIDKLKISIEGPEYSGYYAPTIKKIQMQLNFPSDAYHIIEPSGRAVVDPKVLNGIRDMSLNISKTGDQFGPYSNGQYCIFINLTLSEASVDNSTVGFENLNLKDNQSIFVTNNTNFTSVSDFTEINNVSQQADISFGLRDNIYYFVKSQEDLNMEIYFGDSEDDNEELKLASVTEKLYDICGNEVKVELDGVSYNVYIMSLAYNFYNLELKDNQTYYWAYKK